MKIQTVTLENQKLAYRESSGVGPNVVLVHGNSCSSQSYKEQLQGELGKAFHLIAFDLPGHGDSDPMPEFSDYSMAGYARVLNEAMAKLEISDAVLVGWSLGGHIALEMSINQLNLKGMMIFGTPPLGFPPDMENAFLPTGEVGTGMQGELSEAQARNFSRSFVNGEPASLIEFFVQLIMQTDPNARLGLGQNLGPDTYADEIVIVGETSIPLAIFHGEAEKLVNVDYIRRLDMPGLWRGEVQIIANAGHAPQLENAPEFDRLLIEFIEECTNG